MEKQLLYFTAPWCGPCKTTKPIIQDLIALNQINCTIVDVEDSPIISQVYNIRVVPTFIVLVDNKEERRMTGAKTRQEILNFYNNNF